MLILTRKPGERIRITDGDKTIEIHLQWSKKSAASIGIVAPQDYKISRPKENE